jgi:DNA/RNA endonuclease YhcR with UshA esterase domain
MKKVVFLSFAIVALAHMSIAQVFTSGFESWSGPNSPDGWMGSTTHSTDLVISQSSDAQSGNFSCRLVTTISTHRRFATQSVSVTAGKLYTITFFAKGVGEIRTGLATPPFAVSDYIYNSYVAASTTWTQYTQTIIAPATANSQFILSVLNTVGPDGILVDNVVITESDPVLTPIYDIQFTTNMTGASPLVGQNVVTTGVVTGTYIRSATQHGYFIQDGSGAWNGIHVFMGSNSNLPAVGSLVQVAGSVSEFNGLTQITSTSTIVLNLTATLPTPVDITTLQLSQEERFESVLVRVLDAACTIQNASFGMWEINDGSGPAKAHNLMVNFTPTLGSVYNITGVVDYSFAEFRICPRTLGDIVLVNSNVQLIPIYDIQFTTATDGSSTMVGLTVTTSGIVTALMNTSTNSGFFIQDGTGPWNGIYVNNSSINPSIGDLIELTGVVGESFNLTRISNISAHTIVSSGNALPEATVVTTQLANTEPYESVFVRVQNATCTNTNAGFGQFRVNDGSGDVLIDDEIFSFTPVFGNAYNIQGPVFFSFGEFKILPRMLSDIQTVGFASLESAEMNEAVLYPNPADEAIAILNYEGSVTVLDALGRVVLNSEVSAAQNQMDVSNLVAGVYFAVIDGQTIRFIKK